MATPRSALIPAVGAPRVRAGAAYLGAVLSIVLSLGLLLAAPAAAHSDLTSSTPASGSTLDTPPAEIVLVFNEEIAQTGLQVVAQGPAGTLTLASPAVDGRTVVTPWPADAGGGDFRVSYRVVSADGHPIDGTIPFMVTGAPAAGPSVAASPADGAATDSEGTSTTNTGADSSGGFPLWVPVIVVVAGVGIGAVIARTLRGRRTATESSGDQASEGLS